MGDYKGITKATSLFTAGTRTHAKGKLAADNWVRLSDETGNLSATGMALCGDGGFFTVRLNGAFVRPSPSGGPEKLDCPCGPNFKSY